VSHTLLLGRGLLPLDPVVPKLPKSMTESANFYLHGMLVTLAIEHTSQSLYLKASIAHFIDFGVQTLGKDLIYHVITIYISHIH